MKIDVSTERMIAEVDEDGIGRMVFNNPAKRNALSLDMWRGIAEILERFETDDEVRVAVMSGTGGKAFVSGADISEFDKKRSNAEQRADYGRQSARGGHALATFRKPLIAEITGFCIGGGPRHGPQRGRPLRDPPIPPSAFPPPNSASATSTAASPSSPASSARRRQGTSCCPPVSSTPTKRSPSASSTSSCPATRSPSR